MNILDICTIKYSTQTRVDPCGGDSLDTLHIPLVESALFRFHFIDDNKNGVDLSDGVFELGIDDDYSITSTALVYEETPNESNWTLEDLTKGYVSFDANIHTNEMVTAIGDQIDPDDDLSAILEVWFTPTGGTRTLIAQMEVSIGNIVLDESSPVPSTATRVVTHDADGDLVSPANFFLKNRILVGSNAVAYMATQNVSALSFTGNVASSTTGVAFTGNLAGTTDTLYRIVSKIDQMDLGGWTTPAESDLGMANFSITGATNVVATNFFGGGLNITDLNASQLTSGTIPDARFPSTLPAVSGANLTNLDATDLTGTIAAARMPALTGDVTTSAGAVATTLANTAVTPGSYTVASITVDSKGRVTAASSGAAGASGGTIPYNYMQLSKAFSSSAIGWTTTEFDTGTYYFSSGGYTSASTSLVNGDAYISLPIPAGATGFHLVKPFEISFVATSNLNTNCKVDINVYRSVQHQVPQLILNYPNYCPATANVPSTLSATYSQAWDGAYDRIILKLTFYSKDSHNLQLIDGAFHFT